MIADSLQLRRIAVPFLCPDRTLYRPASEGAF
jgi:hypothetical protein